MLVGGAERLQGTDGERHVASWAGHEMERVVLLCHSLREHIGHYTEVAEALVGSGAQVYGLDQAGHGRSEGSPTLVTDLDAAVDDQRLLLQLARARHPDVPIWVLGHGTGGTQAVRLAQSCQQDVAGLVLCAPLLGPRAGTHLDDPRLSVDPFPPRALSRDPAAAGRFAGDPLVWHGQLPVATVAALHRGLHAIEHGSKLQLPVLWLHGEHDEVVPLEPTASAMQRLVAPEALTAKVIPQARHQLLTGAERERTLPVVTDFLASADLRARVA